MSAILEGSDKTHGAGFGCSGHFGPYDMPRVRHITGIRIHQLTLPESLPYASKLVHEPESIQEGHALGESSRHAVSYDGCDRASEPREKRTGSTDTIVHARDRNHKSSHANNKQRQNSGSPRTMTTAMIEPTSPLLLSDAAPTGRATRLSRHRAPTLAGEAMEGLGLDKGKTKSDRRGSPASSDYLHGPAYQHTGLGRADKGRSRRCFVVVKLPDQPPKAQSGQIGQGLADGLLPSPQRTNRDQKGNLPLVNRKNDDRFISIPASPVRSTPSSPNPSSPLGISRTTSLDSRRRTRTASLSSPTSQHTAPLMAPKVKANALPSPRVDNARPKPSPAKSTHCTAPISYPGPSPVPTHFSVPQITPFYISPIHHPSTYPRFLGLDPKSDFAPWLTYTDLASTSLDLQVWIEDVPVMKDMDMGEKTVWKQLQGVGGVIDLTRLRKRPQAEGWREEKNTLEFTLSFDNKVVYYLPDPGDSHDHETNTVPTVKSRGGKESKSKKGVGISGLHQLVNLHAVIVDTERGIANVQTKLDKMLVADVDHRALRREISERKNRVSWIHKRIEEVEQATRDTRAKIILRSKGLNTRRNNLADADEADNHLRSRADEIEDKISMIKSERRSLLPSIHRLRATHVQTLDTLFPITPLSPSILLYTIVSVPLPIPAGSRDPAPPLTMPQYKVDEKTTSAALGYVGMVLQILGNLGICGQGGGGMMPGLVYPISCKASRSAIKDGVSVMQGPRSFPLYAKGVESYRYEYGVFLLNKNIEMLMQEANIRLLDMRQTLPNLKSLLLTLSSPIYVPAPPLVAQSNLGAGSARSMSGTFWYIPSSRTSSAAWPTGASGGLGAGGSVGLTSPASSVGRESDISNITPSRAKTISTGITTSPLTTRIQAGSERRRSMLSTTNKLGGQMAASSEIESEDSDIGENLGNGVGLERKAEVVH